MSLAAYKGEMKKQDASLTPSYTNLVTPYRVICRQRYAKSGQQQQKQFIKEHKRLEMIQPEAIHGARIHKEFCDNVLTPPPREALITLTPKQERRLLYIMENIII